MKAAVSCSLAAAAAALLLLLAAISGILTLHQQRSTHVLLSFTFLL
jgi:hypothetical protein